MTPIAAAAMSTVRIGSRSSMRFVSRLSTAGRTLFLRDPARLPFEACRTTVALGGGGE
jgi:hypothetical protein